MNSLFKKSLIVEGIVAACMAPLAFASPLSLPTTPLITASAVEPNLMLLLDSSGSMGNIVEDAPYDADIDYYDCPTANTLDNDDRVDIKIDYDDGEVEEVSFEGYVFDASSEDYGCFADEVIYSARLYADKDDGKEPSGYLPANYTGNYLNWYFNSANSYFVGGKRVGTFSRLQIAKKAATGLIDGLDGIRVGLAKYDGGSGAEILTNIDVLSTEQKNTLKNKIDTIDNDGATPLGESLAEIGRYFTLGYDEDEPLLIHPDGSSASIKTKDFFKHKPKYLVVDEPAEVIQAWCQQNFVVAMTDGVPTSDTDVSDELEVYANGGEIFDDVALALFDIDLRPDLKDGNKAIKNNVVTHVIGFADADVLNNTLMENAAKNGGGTFMGAKDSNSLAGAFSSASQSIFAEVASWSAVSFNSSQLSYDSALYQASFNTAGWSGSIKAYELSDTGDAASSASWDAATELDAMDYTARKVFTYNNGGVTFTRTNLSTTQLNDLQQGPEGGANASVDNLINYLKGDKSNEGSATGQYRVRASRLGDIVNSTSIYVGAPQLDWPDNGTNDKFGASADSYSTFKNGAAASRTAMVYVGANDGMLHGFEAATGTEKFAYIPGMIASDSDQEGLHYLAEQDYAHRFYVDLTPTVSDVYINDAWRSLLIGGLRAGGKGLFALDVTDPDNFAAGNVLWEFSSANDSDFGYSYSKPSVAMMNNGKWAVVVGNGYNNSGSGTAQLFILFIEEGSDGTWSANDYIKIDSKVGNTSTPNGLSTPTVVDIDGDSVADRIYAGDLQGNMWAFDVSANNTNQWQVAYKSGNTPEPLFTARNSSDEIQPITSAPKVTTSPLAGNAPNLLVFFGTGKYLEESDVSSNTDVMSYYAVLDAGYSSKTRADLTARELLTTANGLRSISGSKINWATSSGWYFDLVNRSSVGGSGTGVGERVITDSTVRNSILFFNTIIPEGSVCSSGGQSWLMSLNLATGLAPKYAIFDANDDGVIDQESVTVTAENDLNNDGVVDDGDIGYIGELFDIGLASESSILEGTQYTVSSAGTLAEREVTTGASQLNGRLSWEELSPPQ